MNVFVLSCNHHNAGLELREKLAFASEQQLSDAYAHWKEKHPDSELVLLSTCNRVEVYAAADEGNDQLAASDITDFVSQFHNVPSDDFTGSVLSHHGTRAIEHLFEVVCSLDSMVLGEPQIVTQVKDAYRIARENNSCGPLTNVLFQHALAVSARVRSETKLSEGRVSIASVAVGDFGRSIFNRFDNKTVLVIGAGEMAEETLRYLKSEGVERIIVVNRSRDRAEVLASEFGGATDSFENLDEWLGKADVIVSTTGATQTVVDRERFRAVRKASGQRPVFILDLGAPRDFAADVADIDEDVWLFDIDALEATCERNRKSDSRKSFPPERSSKNRPNASCRRSIIERPARSFSDCEISCQKSAAVKWIYCFASTTNSTTTSEPPSKKQFIASSTNFCTHRWNHSRTKPEPAHHTVWWMQ